MKVVLDNNLVSISKSEKDKLDSLLKEANDIESNKTEYIEYIQFLLKKYPSKKQISVYSYGN